MDTSLIKQIKQILSYYHPLNLCACVCFSNELGYQQPLAISNNQENLSVPLLQMGKFPEPAALLLS